MNIQKKQFLKYIGQKISLINNFEFTSTLKNPNIDYSYYL